MVQFASRSRSQVHESCGLPKQEAALHTAVLSSRGVCTRELISLQPRSNNDHLLGGDTRLAGKEGWSADFVVDISRTLSRRRSI